MQLSQRLLHGSGGLKHKLRSGVRALPHVQQAVKMSSTSATGSPELAVEVEALRKQMLQLEVSKGVF